MSPTTILQTVSQNWLTVPNALGALTVVSMVGAAIIILLSRRKEDARDADRRNVTALNDLVKTREQQLAAAQREVETLSAEYKQIAQVIVSEIVRGWLAHADSKCYQENAKLRAELEELRSRLSVYERI